MGRREYKVFKRKSTGMADKRIKFYKQLKEYVKKHGDGSVPKFDLRNVTCYPRLLDELC